MNEFVRRLAACVRSEEGQGLAEYGLVLVLIFVVCVVVVTVLGLAVTGQLQSVADAIP